MQPFELKARAKLNLSLDITGIRPDGYHTIESIMQTISLCDTLTFAERLGRGLRLTCTDPDIPADEHNLCHKAHKAFCRYTGHDVPALIHLEKKIPCKAGLGGGSADAAAVLHGLNRLSGAGLSAQALCGIGAGIGADVPFCVLGGTQLACGIGDELTPLPGFFDVSFVVIKPDCPVDTAKAYKDFDRLGEPLHIDTGALVSAVMRRDLKGFISGMGNAFESVISDPMITKAKELLDSLGSLKSMMTGSGSAVFGVFDDEVKAAVCKQEALKEFKDVFLCATS